MWFLLLNLSNYSKPTNFPNSYFLLNINEGTNENKNKILVIFRIGTRMAPHKTEATSLAP